MQLIKYFKVAKERIKYLWIQQVLCFISNRDVCPSFEVSPKNGLQQKHLNTLEL